ncbi:MAG: DNA alkylation repair protein [Oscillospiraceae bacterium]|nr:DNA alkylation repair protein [Oscillospiraceae bacterium]
MNDPIREELFRLQDLSYRDFQIKLIPTVRPEAVIGVRTPELRRLAKDLCKRGEAAAFLAELPHSCFDENQLHAFILSEMKDFPSCLAEVDRFLPYVDNWATCDQLSPKVFKKHRAELLPAIIRWLDDGRTYVVRFGIGMLMEHFLDADFDPAYPALVSKIQSEEYYVRMMIAWYFATALAKQADAVLPYLEQRRLDPWTHNKTIRKAVESYRITPEQKAYLRTLTIKTLQNCHRIVTRFDGKAPPVPV